MEENNNNIPKTYDAAVQELDEIVKKMQDPECSIDNLGQYTKRAKELLDYCRTKLTATVQELKAILDSMQ